MPPHVQPPGAAALIAERPHPTAELRLVLSGNDAGSGNVPALTGPVVRAWDELLDEYAAAVRLRPAVVQQHVQHARNLMRRTRLAPEELTAEDVRAWLDLPSWAQRTRKAHRASVAAVLGFAQSVGLLADNAAAGVYASQVPAEAAAGVTPEAVAAANAAEAAAAAAGLTEHPARAWARAAGYPHAPTGRLSADLLAAWQAAGCPAPGLTDESPAAAWEQLLDAFAGESRARGHRPRTVQLRRFHCEAFANGTGLHPGQVTRADLIGWIGTDGWEPETRRAVRSSLVQVLGFAHAFGRTPANPAAGLPSVRVPRGAARPAGEIAIRDAVNRARPAVRLMLLLGAYEGLRRGEISGLRCEDVTEGGLHVTGKGGASRVVPMHAGLVVELEAYLRWSGITSGWLFPNRAGTAPLTEANVGRRMSRALPPGVTAHMLRHRFASQAYAATYDIRSVQELLGHSSPAITARYTAAPTAALQATVQAVPLVAGLQRPRPPALTDLRQAPAAEPEEPQPITLEPAEPQPFGLEPEESHDGGT